MREMGGDQGDEVVYRGLGNGFSMKFGTTIDKSIYDMLQCAGVPHDIVETITRGDAVKHIFKPLDLKEIQDKLSRQVLACIAQISDCETCSATQVYAMTVDTGASEILLFDEQNDYLVDAREY